MSPEIEFTDRYGCRLPSSLRICRGDCEGLGWHPDDDYDKPFVRCLTCQGTGRVSVLMTIGRIPGWLVKPWREGFIRFGLTAQHHPPDWTVWKRLRVTLWCCYG